MAELACINPSKMHCCYILIIKMCSKNVIQTIYLLMNYSIYSQLVKYREKE